MFSSFLPPHSHSPPHSPLPFTPPPSNHLQICSCLWNSKWNCTSGFHGKQLVKEICPAWLDHLVSMSPSSFLALLLPPPSSLPHLLLPPLSSPSIYDTKVVAMESELEVSLITRPPPPHPSPDLLLLTHHHLHPSQSYFLTSSLPDLYSRVRSPPFPQLSIG